MSDLSSTVVTWALGGTAQSEPAKESLLIGPNVDGVITVLPGTESSLGDDDRMLVDKKDIQPGGKYYSIVKLQIRYERQDASDQRWAQGTGWLIRDDLLITAGHCSFDHTYQLGRAIEVKAYVGYDGKDSINTANVQFRRGARFLTTSGWYQNEVNRENDVSFLKLEKAFTNVTPFAFQPTPVNGNMMLGVVGYPADKSLQGEVAAQMYAQYKLVDFNLNVTQLNMLEYTISTYGGQSGSPVIVQGQNTAIGTHVYGLGTKNSASVIRGQYGNFYNSYQDAIIGSIPAPSPGKLYTELKVAARAPESAFPPDTEGFLDVLKQVVNVGANIGSQVLSVGSPFMGPVAGPIGAVAGAALSFAGKLTESSMATESALDADHSYKQHVCRAILSEAALKGVLSMGASTRNKYGVLENMQKSWEKSKGNVPIIAQKFGPALMEPALRIAVSDTDKSAVGPVQYPKIVPPAGTESALDSGHQDFVGALVSGGGGSNTEGFLDFLGSVAKVAVNVAPSVISTVGTIVGAVKGESAMAPAVDDLQPHFETVCQRALMGDAALQAILQVPPEELKQEGFFGTLADTVKSIGSTVVKAMPGVIRVVEPLVHDAIQQKLSGESAMVSPQPIGPGKALDSQTLEDFFADSSMRTGLPHMPPLANPPVSLMPNGVNAIPVAVRA